MGKINGMVEATIEDLAFSCRPQGKPAPPVGRECLSTGWIKKNGTHLLDSLEPGLFTSRGCFGCEASAHEAVQVHREWVVTKQM